MKTLKILSSFILVNQIIGSSLKNFAKLKWWVLISMWISIIQKINFFDDDWVIKIGIKMFCLFKIPDQKYIKNLRVNNHLSFNIEFNNRIVY